MSDESTQPPDTPSSRPVAVARTLTPAIELPDGVHGSVRRARPTVWCAGLPLCGRRDFTEAERASLRRARAKWFTLTTVGILLCLAFPAWVFLLVQYVRLAVQARTQMPFPTRFVAVEIALFLCQIPGGLLWLRGLVVLRALSRERAAIEVLRFAGPVPLTQSPLVDPGAWALVQAKVVQAGKVHAIDVARGSGRLLAVDGHPVASRLLAFKGVAETPVQADIAAGWLRPIKNAEGRMATRLLSEAERDEITQRVARLRRIRIFFVATIVEMLVVVAWATRWPSPFLQALGVVACVGLSLRVAHQLTTLTREVDLLRRDVADGRVFVFSNARIPLWEALRCGRPWTVGRVPAPWRRITKGQRDVTL